jgi:hypothetical protein
MIPWGLLALVGAIWSLVALAYPDPSSSGNAPDHGSLINYSDPDPLWEKYGLNKSEEFKYFHEPGHDDILGHYDTRFFTTPVPDEERSRTLTYMIRAYLNFFEDHGLETWIAHGTLLGWWWNGKVSRLIRSDAIPGLVTHAVVVTDHALGLGYRHPSPGHHPALPRRSLQPDHRAVLSR